LVDDIVDTLLVGFDVVDAQIITVLSQTQSNCLAAAANVSIGK